MFLVQHILCTELIGVNEVASVKTIMGKFIIKIIILRQEHKRNFLLASEKPVIGMKIYSTSDMSTQVLVSLHSRKQ